MKSKQTARARWAEPFFGHREPQTAIALERLEGKMILQQIIMPRDDAVGLAMDILNLAGVRVKISP